MTDECKPGDRPSRELVVLVLCLLIERVRARKWAESAGGRVGDEPREDAQPGAGEDEQGRKGDR